MMKNNTKNEFLTVRIDQSTLIDLYRLQTARNLTRSQVIRTLIQAAVKTPSLLRESKANEGLSV